MDLLLQRTPTWKLWLRSLVAGPLFIVSLVVVEWPFASFLMTNAARNSFFGTAYLDFSTQPQSHDAMREFFRPEQGFVLWQGLAMAMLYAALSTWIGLALGRWMRTIQR
jgi:hypothetical protein